jgi:carbon-monoxide dehydrogenase medium subunit
MRSLTYRDRGRSFERRVPTMKPAQFRYFAPATLGEALDLLAEHGEDGKILAGGQSLVPAMNFRLARPESLIDINRIVGLGYVEEQDGSLRIGALARHVHFEVPVAGGALGPFLPRVARHIAHLPIRVRGTFAGSLARADPAAEWCLVAATLDVELFIASVTRAPLRLPLHRGRNLDRHSGP